MATLTRCLEIHSKKLSDVEIENVKKVAQSYRDKGYRPEASNVLAVESILDNLEQKRIDMLKQAGGAFTIDNLPEHRIVNRETGKPKELEAVEVKSIPEAEKAKEVPVGSRAVEMLTGREKGEVRKELTITPKVRKEGKAKPASVAGLTGD